MKMGHERDTAVDRDILRTAIVQTLGEEALRYVARS